MSENETQREVDRVERHSLLEELQIVQDAVVSDKGDIHELELDTSPTDFTFTVSYADPAGQSRELVLSSGQDE